MNFVAHLASVPGGGPSLHFHKHDERRIARYLPGQFPTILATSLNRSARARSFMSEGVRRFALLALAATMQQPSPHHDEKEPCRSMPNRALCDFKGL